MIILPVVTSKLQKPSNSNQSKHTQSLPYNHIIRGCSTKNLNSFSDHKKKKKKNCMMKYNGAMVGAQCSQTLDSENLYFLSYILLLTLLLSPYWHVNHPLSNTTASQTHRHLNTPFDSGELERPVKKEQKEKTGHLGFRPKVLESDILGFRFP